MYSFIIGHLPIHLKCMYFFMYKLHLNKRFFFLKKNMGQKVAFLSLATQLQAVRPHALIRLSKERKYLLLASECALQLCFSVDIPEFENPSFKEEQNK